METKGISFEQQMQRQESMMAQQREQATAIQEQQAKFDQQKQMIQRSQQNQTENAALMSNLLKSSHDSQMTTINNSKA